MVVVIVRAVGIYRLMYTCVFSSIVIPIVNHEGPIVPSFNRNISNH